MNVGTGGDGVERQQGELLALSCALSELAAGARDLPSASRILQVLCEALGFGAGHLLLCEPGEALSSAHVRHGVDAETVEEERRFGQGEGIPGAALASDRAIHLELGRDPRAAKLRASGFRSAVTAPIGVDGAPGGALE